MAPFGETTQPRCPRQYVGSGDGGWEASGRSEDSGLPLGHRIDVWESLTATALREDRR